MNRPGWTHMAWRIKGNHLVEYHCFCIKSTTHHVKDTGPMRPTHYAVYRRPMDESAHPCYCNKRKDHDLTPLTPLINHLGHVWGGFEGDGKVRLTTEGYMKVAPQPKIMDKKQAPIFAALRDKFNMRNRARLEANDFDALLDTI